MVPTTFIAPLTLIKKFQAQARKEQRSMGSLIRFLIVKHLAKAAQDERAA